MSSLIDVTRYSGLRLAQGGNYLFALANLVRKVEATHELWMKNAIEERYFIDDSERHQPLQAIIHNTLHQGELFVYWQNGLPIGFLALCNITPGRSAQWQAYGVPGIRRSHVIKTCALHLIRYAFEPWPDGLGLTKIKAEISSQNRAAIIACGHLGFNLIGTSPFDGLFHGQVTDMMSVELFNPSVMGAANVEQTESRAVQSLPDDANLPAGTGAGTGGNDASGTSKSNPARRTRARGKQRAAARYADNGGQPGPGAGRKAALRERLRAAVSEAGL